MAAESFEGRLVAERYAVERLLGEGGFASTYLARDRAAADRPVALKIFASAKASRSGEFEILKSLYHPHIVEVLSAGRLPDGGAYVAMEFVDGAPFDALLGNPKNTDDAWEAFAQLCRTVSYLHEQGVTHGDLKPSNILLDRRTHRVNVKVIDFGLAVVPSRADVKNLPAGTLAYMAPEVIAKRRREPAADLYALGLLLYQVLHGGRLPFPADASAALEFHLSDSKPENLVPEGHRWRPVLEKILQALLSKDPEKRPTDALEILTRLNREAGADFPIHRGWEKSPDAAVFLQDLSDYLNQVGPVLNLPSVTAPRSFLEEEGARARKYLNLLGRMKTAESEDLADRLREIEARLLIQKGDYRAAAALPAASDRLKNVRALALIFLEQFDEAQRILKLISEKAPSAVDRARALNYRGLAAYNRGRLDEAEKFFESSLAGMRKIDETAGVVSNAMNLGAVRQSRGRIDLAIDAYREALEAAEGLRNSFLLAMLLSNLANLYLSVGAVGKAGDYLKRSRDLAEALGMPLLAGYNLLLAADMAAWRRDGDGTEEALRKALKIFETHPAPAYEAVARLHLAENALRQGRLKEAGTLTDEAERVAARSVLPDNRFRFGVLAARLKIAQKDDPKSVAKALDALDREAGDDARKQFLAKAARAEWELARGELGACEGLAREARRLMDEDLKRLPIAYRAPASDAPRYRAFLETEGLVRTLRKAPADASLWKLVEINRRIVSVRDPQKLTEALLDAALELTGAERGFLIMPEYGQWKRGSWKVQTARHFRAHDLPGGKDQLSQTLINRVLESKKAILVQNALEEGDFKAFKSVQALKLRSILAAPILVHGEMLGALYVDHSKATSLFEERDLNLLKALADQAGIALTNARLYQDSQRREKALEETRRELAEANAQLKEELKKKSEWADAVEEELKKSQIAGPLVARSSVLKHLARQIPQLARQRRPLLLTGEAGVGKSFLAKALHQAAGSGVFHQEACGSFPKLRSSPEGASALEEILENARDGTLFLKEITDLPLPYQRELARRLSQTDVFVIVSTREDPKTAVKSGLLAPELKAAFAGSEIRVPPLRERKEDIAPLAHRFLRELSETQGLHRAIKKAAIGVLHEHDWPGNVRELKLEIERAALASQTSISPIDLSPNLLGQAGFLPGTVKKETVALQDQRAQFEREHILRVLESTGWNKIRAARKLGLSRAMLYVKLGKYKIPLR